MPPVALDIIYAATSELIRSFYSITCNYSPDTLNIYFLPANIVDLMQQQYIAFATCFVAHTVAMQHRS